MPFYQGWQGDKPLFRLDLPKKWIDHCVNMPESGMGYQKVIVKAKQGTGTRGVGGIILNCSILETVEEIKAENVLDIVLTA
jgi:hypothetical protein